MNMDIMITRNEEIFDSRLKDTVETVVRAVKQKK